MLVAAGYLAARIVEVVLLVPSGGRFQRLLQQIIGARWFWWIPATLTVAGLAAGLVGGLSEGGGRGLFSMVVLGAAAVLAGVTRLLDRFINVVAERLRFERNVASRRSATTR